MAEIIKWRVWLAGTNQYLATNDLSEVLVSALEVDLNVVASPNWVPLDVIVLGKKRVQWNGNSVSHAEVFPFELEMFSYDDAGVKLIDAMLRHRFLYLCRDGFEQEENTKYPVSFHADNYCVQVSIEQNETDYEPEQASINKALQFRRFKPLY